MDLQNATATANAITTKIGEYAGQGGNILLYVIGFAFGIFLIRLGWKWVRQFVH